MPDSKEISALTTAEQTSANDLFETSIPNAMTETGYISRKNTLNTLATFILNTLQFSALATTAKNIIPAINEAAQSGGGASVIQKTLAEYNALPTADKMNGSIYKITDKALIYCLDEEYHALKELTAAAYSQLTPAEKNNGTLYIITDEETTAADIPYSAGVSVADKLDTIPTVTTGTVTAGSNVTITQSSIKKYGNVVTLGFKFKTSNPARWATLLTFNSEFAPTGDYVYFSLDNTSATTGTQTAHANVYENRVRLGNLLPDANQEYGGCVTWII